MNKHFIKYLILLSSIEFISYIKAESQCKTNTDCAKYNTNGNTHVCIRLDGSNDYGCYLESEAYCDSDVTCQNIKPTFKFCYTPPWILNSTQKQCFTLHEAGGTCLEDNHCAEGLSCSDNVCVSDINPEAVKNPALIVDAKKGNSNTGNTNTGNTNTGNTNTGNINTDTNADDNSLNTDDTEIIDEENDKPSTKTNPTKTSNATTNKDSKSPYIDLDDEDDKKKKPIEILGLPLWAFLLLTIIPIVFIIAILWGLAVGRQSYREEEERKKGIMAIKNNKKDLNINYNGSTENLLLPKSTSDIEKEDTFKSYKTGSDKSHGLTSNTSSSNSTIVNNLMSIAVENNLNSRNSQQTLEVPPKTRKPKKSGMTSPNLPQKPKKPKSTVSSEYSDSNSHRGLLTSSGPMGTNASESGAYPNYFNSAASSAVAPGYFAQNPMSMDPNLNAYYYQQYMAAQAHIQAAQAQYINPYLIDQGLGGMQYQHMYGVGMGMPTTDGALSDNENPQTHKKHKHKK